MSADRRTVLGLLASASAFPMAAPRRPALVVTGRDQFGNPISERYEPVDGGSWLSQLRDYAATPEITEIRLLTT